jgi:hypothetical protein
MTILDDLHQIAARLPELCVPDHLTVRRLVGAPERWERRDPSAMAAVYFPPLAPLMVRVRTERLATHCAGRETAPRDNGDRFRNASGAV